MVLMGAVVVVVMVSVVVRVVVLVLLVMLVLLLLVLLLVVWRCWRWWLVRVHCTDTRDDVGVVPRIAGVSDLHVGDTYQFRNRSTWAILGTAVLESANSSTTDNTQVHWRCRASI